jgi:hypothetical protein
MINPFPKRHAGGYLRSSAFKKELSWASIAVVLLLLLMASPLKASSYDQDGDDDFHVQCWSLGASVGRVERLSGGLGELAGPDDGVIILEGIQNSFLTPYTSEELQISLFLFDNFTILQGAYGRRWSTVPFPKVFLRPWIGAYLTFNLLEDSRDINAGDEEYDGLGVGLAAAAGVTMRLSRSAALEVALRGDQVFMTGWLESGDFFSEAFRMRGGYLRLVYFFQN